jgi:DNA-binding protein YbaB
MKNRFRESYRDKPEIEVNGPVNVVAVTVDSRALDVDQRQALRQALLAAKQATGGPVIDADYEENE